MYIEVTMGNIENVLLTPIFTNSPHYIVELDFNNMVYIARQACRKYNFSNINQAISHLVILG